MQERDKAGGGGGGGGGDTVDNESLPLSRVSILEVTIPTGPGKRARGDLISTESSGSGNPDPENHTPNFRTIFCEDIPEPIVSCSLSPDGRRLGVSLSGGRVVTWMLPPVLRQSHPPSSDINNVGNSSLSPDRGEGEDTSLEGEVVETREDAPLNGDLVIPPSKCGQPEFCIPHLPSPEERIYKHALQEYNRRLEAGEIPDTSPEDGGTGGDGGGYTCASNLPPIPPASLARAYHVAHIKFMPAVSPNALSSDTLDTGSSSASELTGGGGGGGGLAVWRSQSNVWRLYRLPSCTSSDSAAGSTSRSSPDLGTEAANLSTTTANAKANANADGTIDPASEHSEGNKVSLVAILDESSLPSAEWVLPSPISSCAVGLWSGAATDCAISGVVDIGCGNGEDSVGNRCGDWTSLASCPSLVAIGTENGGVYLCDGTLGTGREGLSRHRARVTALAFHGRRYGRVK